MITNPKDSDVLRAHFTQLAYIAEGIAEIDDGVMSSAALAALPPDEARRMRRKFRKLHRRIRRDIAGNVPGSRADRRTRARYGDRDQAPTQHQRSNRITLVRYYIASNVSEVLDELSKR